MHVFDKRHVHGAWEKKYAMLVKPSLKEEIEGLFHLLADSPTTEAFVLAATLVRQRLERLREFQFLAAISNYLGLKYPFHYGASDIPGTSLECCDTYRLMFCIFVNIISLVGW
jgi:hypothetical protein